MQRAVRPGAAVAAPPPGPALHCNVQVQNEKRKLEAELEEAQRTRAAQKEEARSLDTELQTLRSVNRGYSSHLWNSSS